MWEKINHQLYKKFVFNNFTDAFSFMTKVAEISERINHHPNWTNVYNTVEIRLSTHDSDNMITEKDYQLAELIDAIL
jgi:4a-hydroxytetrahydrobiopterin dehydratase